jgi:hypothetical protein
MYKTQNQKYVDLQIYVKRPLNIFLNLSNKFKSQNLQNLCCFQVSKKIPKTQRVICKMCLVFFLQEASTYVEAPWACCAPPPASKDRPDEHATRTPSTPSLAPAHRLALPQPLSSFPIACRNPSHCRCSTSLFPATPSPSEPT